MGRRRQAEPAAQGRHPVFPHLIVRQRHLLLASEHRAPVPHCDGRGQCGLARAAAPVLSAGEHTYPHGGSKSRRGDGKEGGQSRRLKASKAGSRLKAAQGTIRQKDQTGAGKGTLRRKKTRGNGSGCATIVVIIVNAEETQRGQAQVPQGEEGEG